MHGLIFETSVCYWQNQPGCYLFEGKAFSRLGNAIALILDDTQLHFCSAGKNDQHQKQ